MDINGSDGKLHICVDVAFKRKRWGAQLVFDEDKRTAAYVAQQGEALIAATVRTLRKKKIISG